MKENKGFGLPQKSEEYDIYRKKYVRVDCVHNSYVGKLIELKSDCLLLMPVVVL